MLTKMTAGSLLRATLGAAIVILGGLSFMYNWQIAIVAVSFMCLMNFLNECYAISCMRTGANPGIAGKVGSVLSIICTFYLIISALLSNWVATVAVLVAVVVAMILVGVAKEEIIEEL